MNPFKTVKKQAPNAVLILSSLLLGLPLSHAQLSSEKVFASGTAGTTDHSPKSTELNQVKTYTCPMHPEILSHEPVAALSAICF